MLGEFIIFIFMLSIYLNIKFILNQFNIYNKVSANFFIIFIIIYIINGRRKNK